MDRERLEAEPQIGPIRSAVVTVPAYFSEKRRRATQQAGEIAGLKVALAAGLIHRDIKPANILLGRRGETKIVDLGLVLRTNGGNHERSDAEAPSGRRASTVGTHGYMAPEQAVDPDGVDFRADIYSLGVTLYEATVGEPPFPLADAPRCQEMHARTPVPPPEERSPTVPRARGGALAPMPNRCRLSIMRITPSMP